MFQIQTESVPGGVDSKKMTKPLGCLNEGKVLLRHVYPLSGSNGNITQFFWAFTGKSPRCSTSAVKWKAAALSWPTHATYRFAAPHHDDPKCFLKAFVACLAQCVSRTVCAPTFSKI